MPHNNSPKPATAKTHRAAPRTRVIRAAKSAQAAEAIGELTPGCEIFCFTFGQFSLIDAICELVRQVGPCDVTLSTWTAADADLRRAEALIRESAIKRMRFIVDRSFLTRMPHYCQAMRELFGDPCIRTARSHAKFATITSDRWNLAIRTSMNMNHNARLENIEISDDPALCGFLLGIADMIFAEQPDGTFDADLPLLADLPVVDSPKIEHGRLGMIGLRRPAMGQPVR